MASSSTDTLCKHQIKIHTVSLWLGLFLYSPFVWSISDADDLLQPFVSESLTYDSNLYRSSALTPLTDDFINRATAGILIHKTFSRQVFNVNIKADDNRYYTSQILDHVSTENSAVWNWRVTDEWSGKLGTEYNRSLAGFANTQFLSPDILEQPASYFDATYQLNSNWRLNGGWRMTDTLHSAVSRQNQNTESQIFRGGVTFLTSRGDSIGSEYSHTETEFNRRQLSSNADIAYQENTSKILINYNYSPKLHFDGHGGYMFRSHQNLLKLDFQGVIWRINMGWAPTVKTVFMVSSWHELTSFIELASNYYVSEGVSLAPRWAVTEKISLSGQVRMETQDHMANGVKSSSDLRKDELLSSQISTSYMFAHSAELNLAYQFYQRDSNRQSFTYVGDSVTATIQLKF